MIIKEYSLFYFLLIFVLGLCYIYSNFDEKIL